MEWLSVVQAAVRAAHLAGLISVFGIVLFQAAILRPVLAACEAEIRNQITARLQRLLHFSAALAIAGALIWLPIQASLMSGQTSFAGIAKALGDVLGGSTFGQAVLARLLTLCAAAALAHSRRVIAMVAAAFLAGASLSLQSEMGHIAAIGRSPTYFAHLLHVLAAGAWLGGLPPLLSALFSGASQQTAIAMLQRFSFLGMVCVAILTVTAPAIAIDLIGGIAGLVGTDYGLWALAKIALFALLLALATINKFMLTPAYRKGNAEQAAALLRLSVIAELILGLALIGAAASLAITPPAVHQQPVWPFSLQFAWEGLDYPPLRQKLLWSGAALGCAVLLLLAAALWRRARWPALFGAASLIALAPAPRLDLLFIPAHPASFFNSPTGFSAASIARGAELYREHCIVCHGPEGKASAEAASRLRVFPPDLTAPQMWRRTDGDLFWRLSHGIDHPQGGLSMPGFADIFSEEERWNLIDYLRGKVAGAQIAKLGAWPFAVPAPGLQISCADGRVMELGQLRGQVVRVVAESGESARPPPFYTGATVTLSPASAAPTAGCVSQEEGGWLAYALIGGLAPDNLAGTQFLIDANGWLRLMWRPGQTPDLFDPPQFAAEAKRIEDHPLPPGRIGSGHH